MGSQWFEASATTSIKVGNINPRPFVSEAFDDAVAAAQYDHGHSGHTGTIADKEDFVLFTSSDQALSNFEYEAIRNMAQDSNSPSPDSLAEVDRLLGDGAALSIYETASDKWGPAVALQVRNLKGAPPQFFFFGFSPT